MELPRVRAGLVDPAIIGAQNALRDWRAAPLSERIRCLRQAQLRLRTYQEMLAQGIAVETGRPIAEAGSEVEALLARFDFTFADADQLLKPLGVEEALHPSWIRRRSLGVAVVISPSSLPLQIASGTVIAHIVSGNPVILKPSPLAARVTAEFVNLLEKAFPPGVIQIVQGWGETGERLATHPQTKAISFGGSLTTGTHLAKLLAADFSKDLALLMGGKCAAIVMSDADLEAAAKAVVTGLVAGSGQRCNSTARVLVVEKVFDRFLGFLLPLLEQCQPGDPLHPTTRLGPLVCREAVEHYENLLDSPPGEWVLPGRVLAAVSGRRGHYVAPAAVVFKSRRERIQYRSSLLGIGEAHSPVLEIFPVADADDAIEVANACPFGITASIFTRSGETFWKMADFLNVATISGNVPTSLAPVALPLGGLGASGNGRPFGRGFIRFCTSEQAVQILDGSLGMN